MRQHFAAFAAPWSFCEAPTKSPEVEKQYFQELARYFTLFSSTYKAKTFRNICGKSMQGQFVDPAGFRIK